MKKQSRHSRQHDELQTSRSDMKKAAEKYASRIILWGSPSMLATSAFLAGVKAERRRRKREGY